MSQVHGDADKILDSFLQTWLERGNQHVESSPEGHLAAMMIQAMRAGVLRDVDENTSDGFHTFGELYWHRMLLTAALFRALDTMAPDPGGPDERFAVHKSRLHSDGEIPFPDSPRQWFIVVAQLPAGQISYHYPLEYWDLFRIPEQERAAEFDGHTSADVAERLQKWIEGDR